MSSAQRTGLAIVGVVVLAMVVLVIGAMAKDLATALGEQHRDHVACAVARIEAAQRGEQDVRACWEGDDVHGSEGAVNSGKGA